MLSSDRPDPASGWPPPGGCAAAGRPLWTSDDRTRPPTAPVRTRARDRYDRGGRPGVHPGRPPPRPTQHDGQPGPPGRSPGPPGRRGPRRSWSAATPHRSQARRCGHAGGPAAPQSSGPDLRTCAGTRPRMLRPAAQGCWRRRRTTGPGTRRGRTGTVRGRWPARGCSTPPGRPRVWRCRPPPRLLLPAFVGASERTLGALLLGKWFGSSVERIGRLHPLWQVLGAA
jgi:hypothetical protein